jgi:pimeloyl-ACP methyl ester carboxylesterase
VIAAMGDTPADEAVVVGHSMGGLTIPVVAARRPVSRLVFLCALVPRPGLPFSDDYGDADLFVPGPSEATKRDELDRSYWPDPDDAISAMYADCDPAAAREAVARLRPQARRPNNDPTPIDAWPDVPSTAIVCGDDMMLGPGWIRRVSAERLGVKAIELPGSHSPMLSRPGELADVLAGLV